MDRGVLIGGKVRGRRGLFRSVTEYVDSRWQQVHQLLPQRSGRGAGLRTHRRRAAKVSVRP